MTRRGAALAASAALVAWCAAAVQLAAPGAATAPAPALIGLRIAGPASVAVGSSAATVGVTLHVSEPGGPGLSSAAITATCTTACASGSTTTLDGTATFGSGFSGGTADTAVLTVSLDVPSTAQSGTWNVTDVTLTDTSATVTTLHNADLGSFDSSRHFAVTKTADSTGPVITSVTVASTTVDVTTADQDAEADVHFTDATGLDRGQVVFTDTNNAARTRTMSFTADNLTSGTAKNGVVKAVLPNGWTVADADPWQVSEVDATDQYGNSSTTTPVPAAPTVTVQSSPDTTGPALSNVSFTPSTVSTATGPARTTLGVTITDATSGFENATGVLKSATTSDTVPVSIDASNRTSGNTKNGTYQVSLTLPARAGQGSYHLASVDLTDRDGNPTSLDSLDSPALTVQDPADTSKPVLTSFSVAPATVNSDLGATVPTVVAGVSDTGSGVASVAVTAKDASNNTSVWTLDPSDLVAGTALSGTLLQTPVDFLADGHYTISTVVVTDLAGNAQTYTAGTQPVGAAGFTVADHAGDTTGPQLTSLTVSPAAVTAPGSTKVTLKAADLAPGGLAPLGIASAVVTFTGPSGSTPMTLGLSPGQLTAGSAVNGTFAASLAFPKYTPNGTWTVSDVLLTDQAGNPADYSGAQLQTALGGPPPAVTLSGPTDTAAPALSTLTAPATVDSSTGASTATVTVTATDTGSGVCRAVITATSPSASGHASATLDFTADGCAPSETGTAQLSFPQFTESGAWTLSVTLTDAVGNQVSYDSASLAALSQSAHLAVTAASDTSAPAVSALSFDPATVDTTSAPATVVLDVHLTDTGGSGTASATAILTGPSDATKTAQLQRVGGSATDGIYQGAFSFAQFSGATTWTITDLSVVDNLGNGAGYSTQQLTGHGPTTVSTTGSGDSTAPTAGTVSFAPSSLNVTTADGASTVSVELSDDVSGVASASLELVAPDNSTYPSDTITAPTTGSRLAGTWQFPVTVPQFSPPGQYVADDLVVTDVAGNSATFGTSALGSNRLQVTSTQDLDPPDASSALTLTPTSVNVSSATQTVTLHAAITDDASGFAGGTFTLTGPGPGSASASGDFDDTPVSGSATNGTFAGGALIPQFAAAGTWTLSALTLFDNFGHEHDYGAGATALPATPAVTVVDSNADTKAPALAGATITPHNTDIGNGQRPILVDLHLTDDHSGVSDATIRVTDPSQNSLDDADLTMVSGTPTDGHWQAHVLLPAGAEQGTWTVSRIVLEDVAGHSAVLTASAIPSSAKFVVSDKALAPGAPSGLSATPAVGSLTLHWTPPADDGGADITAWNVAITPAPSGQKSPIKVTGATPAATIRGLASGTAYTVKVAALNSSGAGAFSSPVALHGAVFSKAKPVTGTAGHVLTLSTTLTDATTHKPIGGAAVQLLSRAGSSGAFALLATAHTSAKGVAKQSVHPAVDTSYEWTFAGTRNKVLSSTSGATRATVAATVQAATSAKSVKHGKPVQIYGTANPASPGGSVKLQSLVGKTWQSVPGTAKIVLQTLPNGTRATAFVLTFTPPKKGSYQLRAVLAATKTNGAGTSNTVQVKAT